MSSSAAARSSGSAPSAATISANSRLVRTWSGAPLAGCETVVERLDRLERSGGRNTSLERRIQVREHGVIDGERLAAAGLEPLVVVLEDHRRRGVAPLLRLALRLRRRAVRTARLSAIALIGLFDVGVVDAVEQRLRVDARNRLE